MKQKSNRQSLIARIIEFIKLQIAGNILFWGTYLGYFISDYLFHEPHIIALALASIIAHFFFFLVSRDWVFDENGQRKSAQQLRRFIIFMGMNYFINIGIIFSLEIYLNVTPYVGQFIAGFFFTIWNYLGLKFWVFEPEHVKHQAITYQPHKSGKKKVHGRSTKQKTA